MDDVTVTVSAGTTPTFTWTPACTVWSILVEERYTDRWRIVAQSEIGIAPGVRYGTLPDGATETIAALPLTAGREHDVNLFGGTPTTPLLVAVQTFTP